MGVVLAGCAALQQVSPARVRATGPIVGAQWFEPGIVFPKSSEEGRPRAGYRADSDALRAVLAQRSASGFATMPLLEFVADPVAYQPHLADEDAWRLETWFAERGYFDARFLGWTVRTLSPEQPAFPWPWFPGYPEARRAPVLQLRGHLVQGPQSRFRSLDIARADERPMSIADATYARTVRNAGDVVVDQPFVLSSARYARDRLEQTYQDNGYAYASVDLEVDAYPEQQAVDVDLLVDPGRVATLGEVRIDGLVDIDEAVVRLALDLAPRDGKDFVAYGISKLRAAQRRLVDLGVFQQVTVTPDLSDPSARQVPIDVQLAEAPFAEFRAGFGFAFQQLYSTVRIPVSYQHLNLDRRLLRLRLEGYVGGAVDQLLDLEAYQFVEPVFQVRMDLTRPYLIGRSTDLALGFEVQQDLLAGAVLTATAEGKITLVHRIDDDITLSVGPSLEWVQPGSLGGFSEVAEDSVEGLALRAAYGSTYDFQPLWIPLIGGSLTIDWRRGVESGGRLTEVRRGYWYHLAAKQAIPVPGLGLDYAFTDLLAEARLYATPRCGRNAATCLPGTALPFTLATRFSVQGLARYDDRPFAEQVPYPNRLFLGGPSTLRAFQTSAVGPYNVVCVEGNNPTWLPQGGGVSAFAGGELRYRLNSYFTLAAFGSGGWLVPGDAPAAVDQLRGSAGAGFRVNTPVGPIRVDLAFRPPYPEDAGPGASPTDGCVGAPVRPYDLVRGVGGPSYDPPVVTNLVIAIGEAF